MIPVLYIVISQVSFPSISSTALYWAQAMHYSQALHFPALSTFSTALVWAHPIAPPMGLPFFRHCSLLGTSNAPSIGPPFSSIALYWAHLMHHIWALHFPALPSFGPIQCTIHRPSIFYLCSLLGPSNACALYFPALPSLRHI